jgi:hypothetical protein
MRKFILAGTGYLLCHKRLFTLFGVTMLAGCASTVGVAQTSNASPKMLPACTANRICVDVIVVDVGDIKCPVYTLYKGVLNGEPTITKGGGKKILWRTANTAGNAAPEVDFRVYFDPFVGQAYSGTGSVTSGVLASGSNAPPSDVQFKYTITVDNCTPLDPMLRVQ